MCTSVASCLSGFRISGGAWCCSNALLPCNLLGELARLLPLPCLVSAAAWRLACLRAHCIAAAGAGPPLARAPKLAGAQQQRGRQVATRLLRLAPAAGLCAAGRLDAARGLTSISTRPVAARWISNKLLAFSIALRFLDSWTMQQAKLCTFRQTGA